MAIDLGTETITTTMTDRLWHADFYVDNDLVQQLRFHREELIKNDATGEIIGRDRGKTPVVQRTSIQIRTNSYTAGGVTATGLQILQLINKMADVERQHDIDNPVGPP